MPTRVAKERWTLPFVVLIAFVVTLPFGLWRSFGPLDLVHLTLAVTVGITAVLRVAAGAPPWRWHPSAMWLVLLFCLQTASMVMARDTAVSLRAVVTGVMGLLLALTVHSLCVSRERYRDLVAVLVAVGAVVGLYGLLTAGALEAQFSGAGALSGRAEGIFNQPNQLGTFSAVLLLIGCGQALGARTRAEAWVGAACALLSGVNLVLSFSRGAWVGAALGGLLLVLLVSQPQRRSLLRTVGALLAAAVPLLLVLAPQVLGLVTDRVASITDPATNPNDARPLIYLEAYRQILQRPMLGQGPGNFEVASLMAESPGAGVGAWHAHNLALQVASESGLLALAALAVVIVSLGARVWRSTRTELPAPDAALALGLACAMIAVLGQGLVDFTLGNPILLYLVWTVVGSLLAVTGRRATWQSQTAPRERMPL